MKYLGFILFLLIQFTYSFGSTPDVKIDSLKNLIQSKDKVIKSNALIELATLFQISDTTASKVFYNSFKAIYLDDLQGSVYQNLKIKQIEYLKNSFNFNEGVLVLKQAMMVAKASQNLEAEAKYHQLIAPNYFFLFKYDSCNYHLDKATKIYTLLKDTSQLGSIMIRKSGTQYALGDYEKAIKFAFEATELFKASNDRDQLSVAYLQLGNIFFFLNDFLEAENYYNLSLKAFEISNNEKGYYRALSNLGLVKTEQKKFRESIPIQLKAANYFIENRQELEKGNSYQYLSGSYEGLGMLDSAEYYNNLALKSIENSGYLAGLSQAILMKATFALHNSEYKSALNFAKRSFEISDSVKHFETKKDAAFKLSEIYELLNNTDKSLSYLKIANQLRDSLDIDPYQLKKYAEKHRSQIENYQYELSIANEKSLAEKEKSEKREIQLILAITVAVVSLFLLIITIFYLLKNKKLTKELATKQQKIKDELVIKESLLGEIHHRVKNNLQVISSMLSLQSQYIEDHNFNKIISDCKSRINSMSLIHESLYKKVDGKEAHFSKYIRNLIPRLIDTYNIDESKIKLKMNLEDLYLTLDESIPSGLIINEIVSNSLKHAFPKGENGLISIDLEKNGNTVYLKIADNGVGIPEGYSPENLDTFGFLLINTLVSQLEAKMEVVETGGLSYTIIWEAN